MEISVHFKKPYWWHVQALLQVAGYLSEDAKEEGGFDIEQYFNGMHVLVERFRTELDGMEEDELRRAIRAYAFMGSRPVDRVAFFAEALRHTADMLEKYGLPRHE